MEKVKCYFTGCKFEAENKVTANWRKSHIFHTCACHTPPKGKFYTIVKLEKPA